MPVLWDSVLAGAVAHTLQGRLRGARVRAIHLDHEQRDLYLFLREGVLLARLHPTRGELLLLPPSDPFEGSRALPARVARVRALTDDRVVLLELRRLRGPGARTLVLEWIPTRWNALLLEGRPGDGGPLTIRHVLVPREGGDRPALPGRPWSPPPPTTRLGARRLPSRQEWEERLHSTPPEELLSALAWTSPLNRALLEPGEEPGDPWTRWCILRRVGRGEEAPMPVRVPTRTGWTPYPVPVPGSVAVEGDLLDAFREALQEEGRPEEPGLGRIPPGWLSELEARIRSAEGRLRGLSREMERAPDPEPVRARGDLLLARFGEIPRGAAEVTLEDFDGTPVHLVLDPRIAPHENAALFYAEAARIQRAREQLPGRISAAREVIARLETLLERARAGEADPGEVRAALPDRGRAMVGAPPGTTPSLPFRRYRSSGGIEIRVGRGARFNDDLTFHHSSPGDIWLHAREAAGAHVILRWGGPGNPPARDLEEAGILAALHSRARTSGSVPVDWTLRRYVRKPRKAPPGRVVPERVRTLFVEPDPEVERRLREEDPAPPTPPSPLRPSLHGDRT